MKKLRSKHNIVIGQNVNPIKAQRARELRHAMTPEEKKLWAAVRANRLGGYHFRRQQVIDGFLADFYCHAAGLVVEVDGGIHQKQADYDAARDHVLATRTLHIVRISNHEIRHNFPNVLQQLLALCQQLTSTSNSTPSSPEQKL